MVNFNDLEEKIQASLDADVNSSVEAARENNKSFGEAVAFPAFRATVYYGQLSKLERAEIMPISKEEMKDHLDDFAVQAVIFAQSYSRQVIIRPLSELMVRSEKCSIRDLEIASSELCNSITHKKHEGGDQDCYEHSAEKLMERGQRFLSSAIGYIQAKIEEYDLGTSFEEHFNRGFANVLARKGKDKAQITAGSVSAKVNEHHYTGKPVMERPGYFIGYACQLGKESTLPEGVDRPTIFVAERFEPSGKVPKNTVALVAEQGGKTCHLAVLARENNIPATFGVGGVSNVKDGDILCVDLNESYSGVHRLAELSGDKYVLTPEAEWFYKCGNKLVTAELEVMILK